MKRQTRRQFLKSSALVGGTGLLSSCTSIDQYFKSDSSLMLDRVIIVGAGLAGLNAAYQLKKRRIPFCVFEAGETYGGRIRTLYHYNQDDQYVDVGGRSIESTHQDVFSLCKELGLKIHELGDTSQKSDQLVWADGKAIELRKVAQELVPFFRKVSQLRNQFFEVDEGAPTIFRNVDGIQNYDRISVDDLLGELQRQMSPAIRQAILKSVTSAFGTEPQEISALQFLYQFSEHASQMPFQRGQAYGIEGGTSLLTQKLFERSDSIVKDYSFKFRHRCTSIGRRGSAYQIHFETDSGTKSFVSNHILFAMPSSQLKTVYGWQDLDLDPNLISAIQNASLSQATQVLFKTSSQFWGRKYPQVYEGKIFGDFSLQRGENITTSQSGNSGVYAFQFGGVQAVAKKLAVAQEAENFLQTVFQPTPKDKIEFSDMISWGEVPTIQGYRTVNKPGEFFKNANIWKENSGKGIYFSGEHVHPKWLGTMQGALVSSDLAIQKLMTSNNWKV